MKQILDSKNVCHYWAHQRQNELTEAQINKNGNGFLTPSRNVFSEGKFIYSYGRHFCMGRMIDSGYNGLVILSNESYSVTTSKHQRELLQAVSHLNKVYCAYPEYEPTVRDQQDGNDKNLNAYRRKLYELRDNLGRAKKPQIWADKLIAELNRLDQYISLISKYTLILTNETVQPYIDLYREFNIIDLQKDAKQFVEKQKAEFKKQCEKIFPQIDELKRNWENNGMHLSEDEVKAYQKGVTAKISEAYYKDKGHNLRVIKSMIEDKLQIETSLGVKVEIEEAKAGFFAWQSGRLKGYKFAGFTVTQSDEKGFTAGCHTLKAETINRIAKQLNWI